MLRMQREGRGADVDEPGLSADLASTKRALSSAEESLQALRIKIGELQDENGALRVRLRVDSAYAAVHLDMFSLTFNRLDMFSLTFNRLDMFSLTFNRLDMFSLTFNRFCPCGSLGHAYQLIRTLLPCTAMPPPPSPPSAPLRSYVAVRWARYSDHILTHPSTLMYW
jgi:hypothetical protein